MSKRSLQLASRFALPPNSLGYCGMGSAPEKFKNCVITGDCCDVDKELSKFIVLHPYMKTLSKIFKLQKTDYNVFDAYWFGNDLLKKVKITDYPILLSNFKKQGVPLWLIDELTQKIPNKFIPTHLFQILHVGVGRASNSVPYNIDSINNCMIRWGKVIKIEKNTARIKLNSLMKVKVKNRTKNSYGYELTLNTESHPFIESFVPNIKVGDTVAVHWKQLIKILTRDEETRLAFWTKKVIRSFKTF